MSDITWYESSTPTVCEWFALCTNETSTAASHPVLGPVPICVRCATKAGMEGHPEA
ncbi:hypothetical protein [Mycolicibacterium conceptionense]|uniref:hypothetical protein n=1 Tax=Mycolicibacterium conceptionense TaxID=451644 RepID=UPI000B07E367|nr:hypothetical protein [Mycolicibacterium conceptionense]